MNLYLISQTENNDYDAFDRAVVAAESAQEAALIHPAGYGDEVRPPNKKCVDDMWCYCYPRHNCFNNSWVTDVSKVDVEFIGLARDDINPGVIVASFRAG